MNSYVGQVGCGEGMEPSKGALWAWGVSLAWQIAGAAYLPFGVMALRWRQVGR